VTYVLFCKASCNKEVSSKISIKYIRPLGDCEKEESMEVESISHPVPGVT